MKLEGKDETDSIAALAFNFPDGHLIDLLVVFLDPLAVRCDRGQQVIRGNLGVNRKHHVW